MLEKITFFKNRLTQKGAIHNMASKIEKEENEEAKYNYYKGIRLKLIKRQKEIMDCGYILDYPSLQSYIHDNYQILIDEKTLKKLFNESEDSAIYPHYLIPVCNALGLNICDIMQYDDKRESSIASSIKSRNIFKLDKKGKEEPTFLEKFLANDITFLTNEFYEGEYQCYYFYPQEIANSISNGKHQPQVNHIREATLKIEFKKGETIATLTEKNTLSNNDFTFIGRVIRLQRVDKVYIFLSEQKGNGFIWLLFNDIFIKKRELYYKEVAMMTHSIASHSNPIFGKMILTKNPIDINNPEFENIIRGILTFNTEEILVSEEKVSDIINKYPELEGIFNCKKSYYTVSQYDIINSNRLDWSYNKRVEALLNIMSASNNHIQSVVSQEQHMHNFFFDLQGLK